MENDFESASNEPISLDEIHPSLRSQNGHMTVRKLGSGEGDAVGARRVWVIKVGHIT